MLSVVVLNVVMLSVRIAAILSHCAQCLVSLQNVVMLSVFMPNVVAPFFTGKRSSLFRITSTPANDPSSVHR